METCKGKLCPRLQRTCIEHECAFYQHVFGQHPQSGEKLDHWDCSDRLQVLFLVNLGRQTNDLAGSIDSMRNEVNAGASTILLRALGANLPGHPQLPEEKDRARLGNTGG